MNLIDFYDADKVEIIDTDGKKYVGDVMGYIYPEDNENGKESICVDCGGPYIINFYVDEIKEIREI